MSAKSSDIERLHRNTVEATTKAVVLGRRGDCYIIEFDEYRNEKLLSWIILGYVVDYILCCEVILLIFFITFHIFLTFFLSKTLGDVDWWFISLSIVFSGNLKKHFQTRLMNEFTLSDVFIFVNFIQFSSTATITSAASTAIAHRQSSTYNKHDIKKKKLKVTACASVIHKIYTRI